MDRMPEPGDVCPGFVAEAGACWRMVYSRLQATHCSETAAWTGRRFSPKLEGLTGLREFGRRRA
jgi:hypothetical protein